MERKKLNEVLEAHRQWLNHGADGRRADLRGADLSDADLSDADLRRADLRDAVLPHSSNCPEEGAFVGFKKLGHGTVCKLSIPAEARRVSALCGRKCRAEFADVVEGEGKSSRGLYYETAKRVHPDSFDDDIRVECSNGIHFFLTRREAEEW